VSDDADLTFDDLSLAGVWANHALIQSDRDEFVLDFVWVDRRRRHGMVVSRVVLSPRLMRQLLDDGETAWQTWSDSNLPPEVLGHD
jgi:hypothetical protein